MKRTSIWLLLMITVEVACPFCTKAQELFYKLYQFETPYQGHVHATFWNTFIAKSNQSAEHFGRKISDQYLFAHSLEAEIGLLDHLELDLYVDFQNPYGGDLNFIRGHFSALYRIGERFDHWVNVAIYAEYYLPTKAYGDGQEAELRLILDKDIEDFRIVLNPSLSVTTTGPEKKTLQPGISAGLYYRRLYRIQPGVEYYGNYKENTEMIFPSLTLNLTRTLAWNIAAGFGLNQHSDKVLVKSIFSFNIQAIRPSKLFRKSYKAY